ncbi:MAG TPA: hypothetical protein VM261_05380 [Kofleriaceae bacterium]|nr:hypothetical protein [Kofleriaceae bacterium]
MRRPAVLVAIGTIAASVVAIGFALGVLVLSARAHGTTRPPSTSTPDPRLQAAFTDIFRSASAAATRARELHESDRLSATRPLDQ